MSELKHYLANKKAAVTAVRARIESEGASPREVKATVHVDRENGVRQISIRHHHLATDSGVEMGGLDLGPSPVETLLGALGGCLAHTILIQAALREVPLDSLEVTVTARSDPRAGHPKHPDVPVHPQDITCDVEIDSSADERTLQRLLAAAERVCPITSLLTLPQAVTTTLVQAGSISAAAD